MSATDISSIFNIGYDVMGITRNSVNGALSLNLGDSTSPVTYSIGAELWQTFGFASLPSKPSNGNVSAQVISLEKNVDICFAGRDLRTTSIYGQLNFGETCVFSTGPNGNSTNRFLLKDDGSIATQTMLCQVGNNPSAKPVLVQISSDDGGTINLAAGDNGAISIDSTGIKFASNKKMEIGGKEDFTITGKTIALSGGNIQLGANPIQGVVLGGPAFLTYVSNLQSRIAVLEGIIRATPAVNGSPLNAAIDALTAPFPITFPISEVSTTVKATA